MLFAVFRRHTPAGGWLYPLISGVAVFLIAAIAVYVLTSVWREHTADLEETPAPAPPDVSGLAAAEILDRRLASGEITIAEYEQLAEVLGRRHAAAAGAAASNGAATTAV
jgi:uncharacterized membrane protein